MIHNRWRQAQRSSRCQKKLMCTAEKNRVHEATSSDEEDNGDSLDKEYSVKSSLLFRRPNPDFDSNQFYNKLLYLDQSTILGVDNCGRFDIVGMISEVNTEDGTSHGCGKLLADGIKLSCHDSNTLRGIQPEVYAYQNGSKFVAGLPSGDMEIFSTERATGIHTSTQHIGPRRRFGRDEMHSLRDMLSVTDHEKLLEEFHSGSELSCWDNGSDSFRLDRDITSSDFKPCPQWAFREGGGASSSALIAACIDAEGDCFSLRIIDERIRDTECRPTVFVDTSSNFGLDEQGIVQSICFTGEYGLVVAMRSLTTSILPWYDLRMLWKQPVKAMNVTFPHHKLAGISSCQDLLSSRNTSLGDTHELGDIESLEQYNDCQNDEAPFFIEKLSGSNNSKDCFAATLRLQQSGNNVLQHLLFDLTHSEDLQVVERHGEQKITCFSGFLDFIACYDADPSLLSIYDITRNRDETQGDNRRNSKKRPHSNLCSDTQLNNCVSTMTLELTDMYSIPSAAICMAMDDFGSSVALGTNDGDIYILSP